MTGDMVSPRDGGSAFPLGKGIGGINEGMSLRDYFAAAALQGILAGWKGLPVNEIADGIMGGARVSKAAYVYADAMLAEREKS
jgi:hypothetical protein